jgi:large conductance mechanosensitive channel
MKGFKEFILRGNLVELAVAFIMAAAFAAVVTSFVTVILDTIGKLGGSPDFSNYAPGGVHLGAFFTAVITFLILAVVVYFFVVTPYMKARDKFKPAEAESAPTEDITLLTEIRDLLKDRNTRV